MENRGSDASGIAWGMSGAAVTMWPLVSLIELISEKKSRPEKFIPAGTGCLASSVPENIIRLQEPRQQVHLRLLLQQRERPRHSWQPLQQP